MYGCRYSGLVGADSWGLNLGEDCWIMESRRCSYKCELLPLVDLQLSATDAPASSLF